MALALDWIGDSGIKGAQHSFIRPSHRRGQLGGDAPNSEAAIQKNPLSMTQLGNSFD
jgi:hypothetical protein